MRGHRIRVVVIAAVAISALVVLSSAVGCAETTEVQPAAPSATKKLLVLTHNSFYKHDSLGAAERAVVELGRENGFDGTALEGYTQEADEIDLSFISADYLAQFDAVMMMTNGELPMTDEQKSALIEFVRGGKGFLAVHQTVVTFYTLPLFGELVGAYFATGPIFDPTNASKRIAVLKVEDRDHPATRMLGESWSLHDEFYQFALETWDAARPDENRGPTGEPVLMAFSRDRVNVVLSFDSERTDFTGLEPGWQQFGSGRSFYTSLGHRAELWTDDPTFRGHILGAIRWVLKLEE